MAVPTTPAPVPRTRPRPWRATAVVLAAALALVLVLAIVPLDPTRQTSVNWFEVTLVDQSLPGYNYSTGYQIPPYVFCTPANAIGAGTVSFSWRTLSGDSLISFAAGQTPVTFGPQVFWVYQDNGTSYGGYSISTAPPFDCDCELFLAIQSVAQETVRVTGTFSYNYTSDQTIL